MNKANVLIHNVDLGAKASKELIKKTMLRVVLDEVASEQRNNNFKSPIYQPDRKGKYTDPYKTVASAVNQVDVFDSATSLYDGAWFIFQKLLRTSPVVTGSYSNSHYVDINGQNYNLKFFTSKNQLEELLKDVREIRIYNVSVYANKLERSANSKSKKTKIQNITYLLVNGVYDYFSKKANLLKLRNLYIKVGRSDSLPVLGDRGYTTKDGKKIVIPVIQMKIIGEK